MYEAATARDNSSLQLHQGRSVSGTPTASHGLAIRSVFSITRAAPVLARLGQANPHPHKLLDSDRCPALPTSCSATSPDNRPGLAQAKGRMTE